MPNLENQMPESRSDDLDRVAAEIADRLRARGVPIRSGDTSDDLAVLLDGVEAFELAVEEEGGDLMIAEPRDGKTAEPGDERFALPVRGPDESAGSYVSRLAAATRRVRPYRDL
jgi:hypothetical protein